MILCLDIGFRFTGWAGWNTSVEKFFEAGVLFILPDGDKLDSVAKQNAYAVRLLATNLVRLVDRYEPTLIVGEFPHGGSRNSRAASCMALAFATVITCAHLKGIKLFAVTPNEVKKIVDPSSKDRHAISKQAVQSYVIKRFGGRFLPDNRTREHVADAMAALAVYLDQRKSK